MVHTEQDRLAILEHDKPEGTLNITKFGLICMIIFDNINIFNRSNRAGRIAKMIVRS